MPWLSVLTDLQNRGMKDMLIVCADGLKGFPEAINSIFPKLPSYNRFIELVKYYQTTIILTGRRQL
jgi:transposase-like protein